MDKEALLKKYQLHREDSGSIPVQVILLTEEINRLVQHLRKHKKDYDSKLGLLKMVSKRRKFLNYLQRKDNKTYHSLVNDLGLRR
jgi:small subunit ribosomal protein S15